MAKTLFLPAKHSADFPLQHFTSLPGNSTEITGENSVHLRGNRRRQLRLNKIDHCLNRFLRVLLTDPRLLHYHVNEFIHGSIMISRRGEATRNCLFFRFQKKAMPENAEQLARQPEVREALDQTRGKKIKARAADKFWFVTHLLGLIGCGVAYYGLAAHFVPLPQPHLDLLLRLVRGTVMIIVLLAIAQAINVYAIGRVGDAPTRYTLKRIHRLIVALLIAIIAISVFFVNWYGALISVGVLSVIVGLSVQTPMASFIGWIYILVRRPYRVGDRIQIDDATGDVIDVSYIDTTLWEFGGKYLSTDHPSGRIIKFPNSKVLSAMVFNYSWPLFPYIWNEIKFNIAYGSDLQFVAKTKQTITEEEIGKDMMDRVEVFRQLLAKTPVDELEVREHPRVIFRPSENTWLEAIVRYLVPPREAGTIKTRLIPRLLAALNAAPERVMFPKGDAR
jgi:small-conductance mechanosensitive channel